MAEKSEGDSRMTESERIKAYRDAGCENIAKYAEKYGADDAFPYSCWRGKRDWPKADRILKRCLDAGKTWREIQPPDGKIY